MIKYQYGRRQQLNAKNYCIIRIVLPQQLLFSLRFFLYYDVIWLTYVFSGLRILNKEILRIKYVFVRTFLDRSQFAHISTFLRSTQW